MAATFSEILWLRWLLLVQYGLTTLYCDNEVARHIANNPVFHERTKHVEMNRYFVREHVEFGQIKPLYIHTRNQVADIFTEPLGMDRFQFLRGKLGVRDLHAPV